MGKGSVNPINKKAEQDLAERFGRPGSTRPLKNWRQDLQTRALANLLENASGCDDQGYTVEMRLEEAAYKSARDAPHTREHVAAGYLKAAEKLPQFDPARGALGAFLYSQAKYEMQKQYAREKSPFNSRSKKAREAALCSLNQTWEAAEGNKFNADFSQVAMEVWEVNLERSSSAEIQLREVIDKAIQCGVISDVEAKMYLANRLEGRTQEELAQEFGGSQVSISRRLKRIQENLTVFATKGGNNL